MKRIFTEYYSPQKNIFFHHVIDYSSEETVRPKAESYSQYELLYIVNGESEQTINENHYFASAGDLIIINAQQLHKTQALLTHSDFERYILRFSPDLITLKNMKIGDIFEQFLFPNNQAFTILKKRDVEQANVLDFFHKIEKFSSQPNDERTFIQILSTVLELCTVVYQQNKNATSRTQLQVNDHVRAIIHYVGENIFSNISLEKMAEDLYLNPYYISHLFSKQMGMPLKKYINNVKIHRAEEMINAGEAPTSVALKLGYNYYSTFFNAYKKTLGKKPSVGKDKPSN